jgi:hypothetical protein
MRGVYTAWATISSLSAQKTLMLLTVPSTKVVELYSASVSNASNETNEQIRIGIYVVGTLGSPSGTALTPAKHETGDAAASVTVTSNLTVEPTSYSTTPLDEEGVSSIAGYRYSPIPEERPIIAPSAAVGIRLLTTPSAFDAIVKLVFREIG